jgi:hypothetical protein
MGQSRRARFAAGVTALFLVLGLASAQTITPFDDVPPCHPAAAAVARLAATGIVVGFPADDGYGSVNAVRQVFEGLRCADAGWSLRFMRGAPVAFGLLPRMSLVGFELAPTLNEYDGERAVVSVSLTVVLEEAGDRQVLARSGDVLVDKGPDGWRVPYAELAALDLPVFPPVASN